jgi:hypothetical protein
MTALIAALVVLAPFVLMAIHIERRERAGRRGFR